MDRPYDIEGRIIALEAEVSRLRAESELLALENLRVINLLVNVVVNNGLNKEMVSKPSGYTYLDQLDEIFTAVYDIVNRNDSR